MWKEGWLFGWVWIFGFGLGLGIGLEGGGKACWGPKTQGDGGPPDTERPKPSHDDGSPKKYAAKAGKPTAEEPDPRKHDEGEEDSATKPFAKEGAIAAKVFKTPPKTPGERRTFVIGGIKNKANAWGLVGMLGAAQEWVYDRFLFFQSPSTDPLGAYVISHVLRGGRGLKFLFPHPSARHFLNPGDPCDGKPPQHEGFRLIRVAEP